MDNQRKKFRIGVVTTTRAEYGLLNSVVHRIMKDDDMELDLLVSGTHLSEEHGYTVKEIEDDGVPISHRIPIMVSGNDAYAVSQTMANAILRFADCFRSDRPDMLVIIGDRTEMLAIACAAMNERIPMAHYSGGEVTAGAVDDCIRHSLSKMSYLHFTSTDIYRRRVIQLGEDPSRVFNVGALGLENVINAPLLKEDVIRAECGIPQDMPYAVVTFHPVTLEENTAKYQTACLCDAMSSRNGYFYIITKSNADVGGDTVNKILEKYANESKNVKIVDSLGMVKYLSAVKYAAFVMGNSSSGVAEAPLFGTPSINIGDRQKGRILSGTVINCDPQTKAIVRAVDKTVEVQRIPSDIFGDGTASEQIISIIKKTLKAGTIDLKKGFYEKNF